MYRLVYVKVSFFKNIYWQTATTTCIMRRGSRSNARDTTFSKGVVNFYMVKTYPKIVPFQIGSDSWHFDFQTKNAPSARRLCKILIRVDLLLVQCWTHVANLRRSYALCAARIYTWKIFCHPTKNTDTEQFSDNSLSLSCMHACMTQIGTTTWKLVKRLGTTSTI